MSPVAPAIGRSNHLACAAADDILQVQSTACAGGSSVLQYIPMLLSIRAYSYGGTSHIQNIAGQHLMFSDALGKQSGRRSKTLITCLCSTLLLSMLLLCSAVKRMADDFKSRGWPLHVLLNNAGIQAPAGFRGQKTPGGFEVCRGCYNICSICIAPQHVHPM